MSINFRGSLNTNRSFRSSQERSSDPGTSAVESRPSSLKDSTFQSSITSGIEALTMSYNPKAAAAQQGEDLTEEEKEQVANLPQSTFSTFVSPMERKRRMLQKKKEAEEAEKKRQEAEAEAKKPPQDEGSVASVKSEVEKWNAALEKYAEEHENHASQTSIATEHTSNAAAQDSAPPGDGGEEASSDMPPENDREKAKRAAIQLVMKDASLTPLERNQAIQKIIKGEFDDRPPPPDGNLPAAESVDSSHVSSHVSGDMTRITEVTEDSHLAAGAKAKDEVPPMDSSSESGSEESETDSGEEGEEGEEWLSSSSYETGSSYETETSEELSKVSSKMSQGAGESATEQSKAVPAAEQIIPAPEVEEDLVLDGRTRAEFREMVVKLVLQAMPEEVDNVDDLLEECRGREHDLLDTLAFQAAEASVAKTEPTAQAAIATASATSAAQKQRVKELEAQLDQELQNHAALEKQVEDALVNQELVERQQQAQLQAQLDAELQNHGNLGPEQRAAEAQRHAAAAAEQQLEKMQQDNDDEFHRRAAEERERRRVQEERERERELEFQRLAQEEERVQKIAKEKEQQRVNIESNERTPMVRRASIEMEREEKMVREELMRLAEEQRILREEQRRAEEEREREALRLQALKDEAEREERRIQALREQREQEVMQQRIDEERKREELQREQARQQRSMEEGYGRQELQVAQAVVPKPRSAKASSDGLSRGSLRASQTLATRQGGQQPSTYRPTSARSGFDETRAPPAKPASQYVKTSRYDGVDDDELNWRLDSYASLSDYTIVINRARPGPYAPDFDTADTSGIDFVTESSGSPMRDVYYVHKAMIAVGSRRSELLGRRIREAERGQSSEVNTYETVMLDSAANAMGMVLDFCYYPDQALNINVENAVPLVYLGKRYRIRALLEQAEEYVMEHLESSNAMYFLLDSYLYQLEDILTRAIDVTAAHLEETVDFNPIYRLPPELFRRIVLSKELKCDSELLSLIVYSYCGEHHAEDIDVEYYRELTKARIMPNIDPKVALMVLKFYVDLILDDDETCDIMEALRGDSLMNRCVSVVAKHWQPEVCEPLMIDAEWDSGPPSSDFKHLSPHEPAALHRSLPPPLQNYLLEKCILAAKNDVDTGEETIANYEGKKKEELHNNTKNFSAVVKDLQNELKQAKAEQGKDVDGYRDQVKELQMKAVRLEEELEAKTKALEEYKQELTQFRRVPGIHTFGEVSSDGTNIIDKTKCTYSANPDHHYPNHRRGRRQPTQMPKMAEFENLGKMNGYVYNDGKGELLPVFYYQRRRPSRGGGHAEL